MPGKINHQRNVDQFPVKRSTVSFKVVLAQRFAVVRSDDDQSIFRQTAAVQLVHQLLNVIVNILHSIVIGVDAGLLRPGRFGIGPRPSVRIMHIEIVEEGEERPAAVSGRSISMLPD